MKKLSYILSGLLMLGSTAFLSSCGDNDNFWGPHTLTDAEIAEIARQDSIQEAQRNSINADLILEYTAEITISSTSYDGVSVPIDADAIANLFGITTEQLLTGPLAGEENGFDVKGFAIEGTTHADNGTSTNSGAAWGHWWDANGDVKNWGEDAMVYAEFDPESASFYVGQYPGHLTDGQTIKFIEAVKYQDKRAAIVITAIAHARGEVQATVVATNSLTLETSPNDTYAAVPVPGFDAAATLSALGVGSFDEVNWVAVNADGSYAQEYSADPPGFWYDKEGFAGSWGENASVYTAFDGENILIGQMPEQMTEGSTVTISYGAMAGNKIVMNVITVNIVGYQDPETAPEGEPESMEKDITITKPYDAEWGSTDELDVKEELRQAFKMTTYQIFSALKSGEMKLWVNEIGNMANEDGTPAYTGEAPGWWLNGNGEPVSWGDEAVAYVFLGASEESLTIYGGNHPDNCSPTGQVITTKYIIEYNGTTVTYNVTFDITAAE
mgnify:CR=1 FL=1